MSVNTPIYRSRALYSKLSLAVSAALAMSAGSAQTLGPVASEYAAAAPLLPTQATDPVYADWFYNTPVYTFCDAKLLANLWGTDTWGAKLQAGWKLSIGDEATLQQFLGTARQQVGGLNNGFCTWQDADNPPYSWEDLELLAQYWGEPTANDAKLKVEGSLFYGANAYVLESLNYARGS